MKVVALIPSYGERPYLKNMLEWLNSTDEVDYIELFKQDEPLGSATARKILVEKAFRKYGPNLAYLMLDDDCEFTVRSRIREVAALFDKLPGLGLVQIPNSCREERNNECLYSNVVLANHCFMLSGKVLEVGINYKDHEFCDELTVSADTFLYGFDMVVFMEAEIPHHYVNVFHSSKEGSINEQLIGSHRHLYKSDFIKDYSKYYEFEENEFMGIKIPNYHTMFVTEEGRNLHNKNRKLNFNL